MAKESTIGHLIEVIRQENAATRTESRESTGEVVKTVTVLNNQFGKYFDMLNQQRLDSLETEREDKSKKETSPSTQFDVGGDLKGMGFLGVVASILGALGSFSIGVVEGFKDATTLILRQFGKLLKPFTSRMIVPFSRMFASMTDAVTKFTKVFRSNFLLGFENVGKYTRDFDKVVKLRVKDFTTFAGRIGAVMGRINGFFGRIGGFFTKIFTTLRVIGAASAEVSKSIPLAPEIKRFVDGIKFLGSSVKGLVGFGQVAANTAKTTTTFFSTVGSIFTRIGSALSPIAGIFRTLGRVIFFPLTIIMSIFDTIKGSMEGYQEQGILGGILGAVGGLFRGLIGMPLDLLKSAISWIAGKFGLENFSSMLDSFSFEEVIFDAFMKIAEIFNSVIDYFVSPFKKFGSSIAGFFGFDGDATPQAPEQPQTETLTPAQRRQRQRDSEKERMQTKASEEGKPAKSGLTADMFNAPSMTQQAMAQAKSEGRTIVGFNTESIAKTAAEIDARKSQQSGGGMMNVNAPTTTVNNNASTAVYSDPSPATDDLDRASMAW